MDGFGADVTSSLPPSMDEDMYDEMMGVEEDMKGDIPDGAPEEMEDVSVDTGVRSALDVSSHALVPLLHAPDTVCVCARRWSTEMGTSPCTMDCAAPYLMRCVPRLAP